MRLIPESLLGRLERLMNQMEPQELRRLANFRGLAHEINDLADLAERVACRVERRLADDLADARLAEELIDLRIDTEPRD